ncbi:hypothetical protein NIES22_57990 [Calothrix brevissima NIES-22]|nr:hypothetical protein NIES22_57990 [Calothrix brevissima NIES-22]
MSQNLISQSRRERAIALLDDTIHAMIDHHRLSQKITSKMNYLRTSLCYVRGF